MFEIGGLSLST